MAACSILSIGVYMLARYWSLLSLLWISATFGQLCAAASLVRIFLFIHNKHASALAQSRARRATELLAGQHL